MPRVSGLVHSRELTLSRDGERLTGEDRLVPTATARNHDRASVCASLPFASVGDGGPDLGRSGVLLNLPSGQRFTFDAGGRDVALEDSIFFAAPNGPRNTRQIVVDGAVEEDLSVVWTLARIPD